MLVTGLVAIVGGALLATSAHAATTITVTTTADTGTGSLRDAIASASAGDTILLPASASHYMVTSSEIVIDKALTIQGAGAGSTVIDANGADRIFHVEGGIPSGSTLAFKGVTITGGATVALPGGGGVLVDPAVAASLNFVNSAVVGNTVDVDAGTTGEVGGGGIYDAGTGLLKLTHTAVKGNTVTVTDAQSLANGGGGIFNATGALTLDHSAVSGNSATVTTFAFDSGGAHCCSGGGGIYQFPAKSVTVTASVVHGNTASITGGDNDHGGGGLYVHDDGTGVTVTIAHSSFTDNATTVHGTTDSSGSGVDHCCQGGGAIHLSPTLIIVSSTFTGNTATVVDGDCCHGGGAILNYSALNLLGDNLSNNTFDLTGGGCCNGGGAIQDDDDVGLKAVQTLISNNRANFHGTVTDYGANGAGGIYEDTAGSSYLDSTLSGNSTNIASGGWLNQGGGAILALLGQPTRVDTFLSSTIAGNSAPHAMGGGILNVGGSTLFENTIIGLNTAATDGNCGNVSNGAFTGSLTSDGHNIETRPGTCELIGTGDKLVSGAALHLGPLAPHGGPTKTRALLAGSVAINGVGAGSCPTKPGHSGPPLTVDQRGVHRPQGTACDIGAFEYVAHAPGVKAIKATGITKHGATVTAKINARSAKTTVQIQFGTSKHYGHTVKVGSIGAGTTYRGIKAKLSGLPKGKRIHYRIVARNSRGTTRTKDHTFRTRH
jgi:hypothetical protein